MEQIHTFDTVAKYNQLTHHETLHPLVTVIDLSKSKPWTWPGGESLKVKYGMYCVFLKEVLCGDLKYGCSTYDYQEGSLVFMSPGQMVEVEYFGETFQPKGYVLMFHPEFIRGTTLARQIHEYTYFGYQSNEALHLSRRERKTVLDCFAKIKHELVHAIDKHSKRLIISNITLFLDYCVRFYDRQFTTRENVLTGIMARFDNLLNQYFTSEKPQALGLPTVAYCANELHLSSNYFGDLVKKETGRPAHEFIQTKLIAIAKDQIFDHTKSMSQIAYDLGFKYPQHFTRYFKQQVGSTPVQYRELN